MTKSQVGLKQTCLAISNVTNVFLISIMNAKSSLFNTFPATIFIV